MLKISIVPTKFALFIYLNLVDNDMRYFNSRLIIFHLNLFFNNFISTWIMYITDIQTVAQNGNSTISSNRQ